MGDRRDRSQCASAKAADARRFASRGGVAGRDDGRMKTMPIRSGIPYLQHARIMRKRPPIALIYRSAMDEPRQWGVHWGLVVVLGVIVACYGLSLLLRYLPAPPASTLPIPPRSARVVADDPE
jgi:hypothetical protein